MTARICVSANDEVVYCEDRHQNVGQADDLSGAMRIFLVAGRVHRASQGGNRKVGHRDDFYVDWYFLFSLFLRDVFWVDVRIT